MSSTWTTVATGGGRVDECVQRDRRRGWRRSQPGRLRRSLARERDAVDGVQPALGDDFPFRDVGALAQQSRSFWSPKYRPLTVTSIGRGARPGGSDRRRPARCCRAPSATAPQRRQTGARLDICGVSGSARFAIARDRAVCRCSAPPRAAEHRRAAHRADAICVSRRVGLRPLRRHEQEPADTDDDEDSEHAQRPRQPVP